MKIEYNDKDNHNHSHGRHNIELACGTVIAVVVICLIAYGGWKLQRWWHYTAYEGMVQKQIDASIEPLKKRIEELEKRK